MPLSKSLWVHYVGILHSVLSSETQRDGMRRDRVGRIRTCDMDAVRDAGEQRIVWSVNLACVVTDVFG